MVLKPGQEGGRGERQRSGAEPRYLGKRNLSPGSLGTDPVGPTGALRRTRPVLAADEHEAPALVYAGAAAASVRRRTEEVEKREKEEKKDAARKAR